MIRPRLMLLATLVAIAGSPSAFAQAERYELGRRLRAFEVEWDRHDEFGAAARATPSLKAAVASFFSMKQGEAARAIAEAQFALKGGTEPTSADRWANSLSVKPEARLIDASTPALVVEVEAFYPVEAAIPSGAKVRLALADSTIEAPITGLPMRLVLPLKSPGEGDPSLIAEVVVGDRILAKASQTISLVARMDARLVALRKVVNQWPETTETSTIDRESARGQLRLVESLAARMTLESDFPAAAILTSLEEQIPLADQGKPYLNRTRTGQTWITLLTRTNRRVSLRLFVPEAAARGNPLPMVVALHGAGGSENMFFESYGHGAIVDRCRERGWLLVAPRSNPLGGVPVADMVDELAKIYPIDPKHLMLVGHSMGAGQAVASACLDPSRYSGVAALGGGGSIRATPGLKTLPFFVGIGSEDFALKGAKNLFENLKRADGLVTFREYPTIEHLAIVQVALGDVFRFFDQLAK